MNWRKRVMIITQISMPPVGFEPTISAGERPAASHLLRSWVWIPTGSWIFVCCECRVLSGRGLCDELINRPEESYQLWRVIVCDLETSRIGAPYIYMYEISSLRVNDLTVILLTWRKWWTPNNASKWQMGFNSAFKGLMWNILRMRVNKNITVCYCRQQYWLQYCIVNNIYVLKLRI